MSDDSRRTALKGIAAVASTGAVGAGGIIHASEPVAAVEHHMTIDDITVDTVDGNITEMGISQLWFELSWENIQDPLYTEFEFRHDDFAQSAGLDGAGEKDLGVTGQGTETFGYGEKYSENYDVDLGDLSTYDVPLRTDWDAWLEHFHLGEDEDQKTVEDVQFTIWIWQTGGSASLGVENSEFDVTVQRVEPDGDVSGGEGDAFGEE